MYFSENYPKTRPKIFLKLFFPKIFPKFYKKIFPKFSQNFSKKYLFLKMFTGKFFPKSFSLPFLPGQKTVPKSHFWDTPSCIILSEGEGRDRTHPQQAPQGGKVLAGIKSSIQAVSKAANKVPFMGQRIRYNILRKNKGGHSND